MIYLWDIDGTLISAGGAGKRAIEDAFEALHQVKDASRGVVFGGNTDACIAEEMYATHLGRSPSQSEVLALLDAYLSRLEAALAQPSDYVVHDGVNDLLSWMEAENHVFGLCTGNVARGARIKLEPAR